MERTFFVQLQQDCEECADWLEREINPLPIDAVVELHNVKECILQSFRSQEIFRRNREKSNPMVPVAFPAKPTVWSPALLRFSATLLIIILIGLIVAQFLCTVMVISFILVFSLTLQQHQISERDTALRIRLELKAPAMRLASSLAILRPRLLSLCSRLEDLRRSEDPNETMMIKGVRLLRIGYFIQQFKTAQQAVAWMKQGIELCETLSMSEECRVADLTTEADTSTTAPKSSQMPSMNSIPTMS